MTSLGSPHVRLLGAHVRGAKQSRIDRRSWVTLPLFFRHASFTISICVGGVPFQLCLAFLPTADASGAAIATAFCRLFHDLCGLNLHDHLTETTADGAASDVAEAVHDVPRRPVPAAAAPRKLLHRTKSAHCSMHKSKLISDDAIGHKTKVSGICCMGPFEKGKSTIKAVGALNTHFAQSNKARAEFEDVAHGMGVPHTFTNDRDVGARAIGVNNQFADTLQRREAVDACTSSTASRGDDDVKQLAIDADTWAVIEEMSRLATNRLPGTNWIARNSRMGHRAPGVGTQPGDPNVIKCDQSLADLAGGR